MTEIKISKCEASQEDHDLMVEWEARYGNEWGNWTEWLPILDPHSGGIEKATLRVRCRKCNGLIKLGPLPKGTQEGFSLITSWARKDKFNKWEKG